MRLHLPGALRGERPRDFARRSAIIAAISFFTLVDLFAAQALAPQLVAAYGVEVATMGVALSLATLGMAAAGLAVAWFSDRIDRRLGIWLALALLSVPTALIGLTDSFPLFLALRILQGVLMATAFTLTMTFLSEECSATAAGGAMAAYVTGNVAANLFGRLLAAEAESLIGLDATFYLFAGLNLAGAAVALVMLGPSGRMPERSGPPLDAWRAHLAVPGLRAAFAIGFLLLFVFIAVFTYVNFELVGPRFGLTPAMLGLVYLVFLPALVTTPMAAGTVRRHGPARVLRLGAATAIGGLALTLLPALPAVLAGLAAIGAATFFMQAAATGHVGRTAETNRAAANGLYLAAYYLGGLSGAVLAGLAYEAAGWPAAAALAAAALGLAALLARTIGPAAAPAPVPAA